MQFNITLAQLGARPQVELPNPEILNYLGEDGMRKMISDHYDLLKQSNIRGLFPPTDEAFEMAKKNTQLISLYKFVEGQDTLTKAEELQG